MDERARNWRSSSTQRTRSLEISLGSSFGRSRVSVARLASTDSESCSLGVAEVGVKGSEDLGVKLWCKGTSRKAGIMMGATELSLAIDSGVMASVTIGCSSSEAHEPVGE